MDYPVKLERDSNDTYLATFPGLPGATFGDTVEDALAHASDLLLSIVEGYMSDRRPVPLPTAGKAKFVVTLPALEAAKVELHNAMLAAHVNKAELGRRLKIHQPQVDRIVNVRHASQLQQLEAAFAAIGKRLVIQTVDLAPKVPAPQRLSAGGRGQRRLVHPGILAATSGTREGAAAGLRASKRTSRKK